MTPACLPWRRSLSPAVFAAAVTIAVLTPAISQPHDYGRMCVPVKERAGRDFGCFMMASVELGRLGVRPIFWHLDTYASLAEAEGARGPRGTVVQSLGKFWLFTIAESGWRPPSGDRVAEIGPLPINPDTAYTAMYMEEVFQPGTKSKIHRHSGPEAWYTLTGETCLETPNGTMTGHAGGPHVVVPGGTPIELTAIGTDMLRAEALILRDTSPPPTSRPRDWNPKGLCAGGQVILGSFYAKVRNAT